VQIAHTPSAWRRWPPDWTLPCGIAAASLVVFADLVARGPPTVENPVFLAPAFAVLLFGLATGWLISRLLRAGHDTAERRTADLRMERVQSELIEASRLSAMGEVASALAHELNQPLSATASYLQGSLRLLDREPLDRALIREALTDGNEQLMRAGAILRRMRNFAARGDIERRFENLPQILQEAGSLAMIGAHRRGMTLYFAIEQDVGLVLGDRVQIEQVVLNLARNAIEAMEGCPRRELLIGAAHTLEEMVEVSVADTGHGIDADVASRLFKPFVTTKRQGMGVGLSICRSIVEAHGGRIWAEPNPRGGAVFFFTLRPAPREVADGEGI
jgi:two-component system sensor kinase FixL